MDGIVFDREIAGFIDVHLAHLGLAGELVGDLVDHGANHLAGAAPLAQKSTRTGTLESITSDWKFVSVSCRAMRKRWCAWVDTVKSRPAESRVGSWRWVNGVFKIRGGSAPAGESQIRSTGTCRQALHDDGQAMMERWGWGCYSMICDQSPVRGLSSR